MPHGSIFDQSGGLRLGRVALWQGCVAPAVDTVGVAMGARGATAAGLPLSLAATAAAAAGLLPQALGAVLQEVIDVAVLSTGRGLCARTGPGARR